MGKAARNERVKMTATWFNGAAIATVAVGCFSPITASFTAATPIAFGSLNLLILSWIAVSVCLHGVARLMLRRIEE